MVEVSKPFLKSLILKNLEYNDYTNFETVFITVFVSIIMLLLSIVVFFFQTLIKNPEWLIVILLIFLGFEIIFGLLIVYTKTQKNSIKKEIQKN